ncbi:hypothetical protein D9757_013710 [Collybiopsis confluens]|uniref:Uncharacterized protein n=1 Tax=Collybiopsis confluens TaxID=2823264 RepID=A0A8H5FXN4_9AGAR|nr:hypothetical protein D9757_013710 [Collybiopsis confluens]
MHIDSRAGFLGLATLFLLFRIHIVDRLSIDVAPSATIGDTDSDTSLLIDVTDTYNILSPKLNLSTPIHTHRIHTTLEDSVHFQLSDDAEWDSLVPQDGLFHLEKGGETLSIGMFHQLRCLNILRRRQLDPDGADEDVVRHCLNYLRQAVLCRASPRVDPLVGKGKGYYVWTPRECVDWNPVYDTVEKLQQEYGLSSMEEEGGRVMV